MDKHTLTIEVRPEYSPENPCESDGWKLYSFCSDHSNHKDPFEFISHPGDRGRVWDEDASNYKITRSWTPEALGVVPAEAYVEKLKAGLAFYLSYYEHGSRIWSLMGEGPQCAWDATPLAGIVVWEQDEVNLGPTTLDDRREDARSFAKYYSAWADGELLSCDLLDVEDDAIDGSGNLMADEVLAVAAGLVSAYCTEHKIDPYTDVDLERSGSAPSVEEILSEVRRIRAAQT